MEQNQSNLLNSLMFQPLQQETESPVQHTELSYEDHFELLDKILSDQKQEIKSLDKEDLKIHALPLARVKKIMKSDEDVRMISAEAPALFGKACEMFIVELTHRAWIHTEESKRRTLQRSDIAQCISRTDIFDFLLDIVPKDDRKNYS